MGNKNKETKPVDVDVVKTENVNEVKEEVKTDVKVDENKDIKVEEVKKVCQRNESAQGTRRGYFN